MDGGGGEPLALFKIFDLSGNAKEIIDEFPVFSFRLGDLHPHVLSIPFVLLALAFSFSIYLKKDFKTLSFKMPFFEKIEWIVSPIEFISGSILFGSLMFLNFWDLPVYLGIFCASATLRKVHQDGWEWKRLSEIIFLGLSLTIMGYLAFLPYHLGFSSQAGGIIPNIVFITRGIHFWIMFVTLLIPILIFLFWQLQKNKSKKFIGSSLLYLSSFFLFLFMITLLLSVFYSGNSSSFSFDKSRI